MASMREFTIQAQFDPESGMWWGSNDDLPLTTEAPTLDALLARILEIAPEIAALNGHIKPGERVKIHLTADQEIASVS